MELICTILALTVATLIWPKKRKPLVLIVAEVKQR